MHVGANGLRKAGPFGAVLGVDKTVAAQSLATKGAFDRKPGRTRVLHPWSAAVPARIKRECRGQTNPAAHSMDDLLHSTERVRPSDPFLDLPEDHGTAPRRRDR